MDDHDRLTSAPRELTTCSNCARPMFRDSQCSGGGPSDPCGWLHVSEPKPVFCDPSNVTDDTGEFEALTTKCGICGHADRLYCGCLSEGDPPGGES